MIKMRDDLTKLLIINTNSRLINENALQLALLDLSTAQHVGPVSHFRGNSFTVSMVSAKNVKLACNLGDFEVTFGYRQCKISFSPWSNDLGSDGAARSTDTWVKIWKIPLHCWC